MDYIFISKLFLISTIYFILNYFYKNIDWNARGQGQYYNSLNRFNIYLKGKFNIVIDNIILGLFGISGIITFYGVVVFLFKAFELFISNIFEKSSYWFQILIFSILIEAYFIIKVKLNSIEKSKRENKELIKSLSIENKELKKTIKSLTDKHGSPC